MINIHQNNDLGEFFEYKLYEKLLCKFPCILRERDLIKKWGFNSSSVDFLIDIDEHNIIVIQAKYRRTRRRETHGVLNFLKSSKYIAECSKKNIVYGLWISLLPPFNDNQDKMMKYNISCVSCDKINNCNNNELINELLNKTLIKVNEFCQDIF
jgi:hypothetical protein